MKIFEELYNRYPQLKGCEGEIAKAFGPVGIVAVLIVCIGYLFALGVFAQIMEKRSPDRL